jgi:ribosome-associated heat shock protein Hsp15
MTQNTNDGKIRLDKWLWAARFYKTRALALSSIKRGKILYDGQKPKPSREVKLGDSLSIQQGFLTIDVTVKGLSDKRGNAEHAKTLYAETDESIANKQKVLSTRKLQHLERVTAPNPKGRPDKHGRKALKELRRKN